MPDQTKYTAKLAETRILIVGGSSGIGYAVAEAALEQTPPPAAVILSSSNPSRVAAAVRSLQESYPSKASLVYGHACNLSPDDDEQLEGNLVALLDAATEQGAKKLDHVVHSAGDQLAVSALEKATMAGIKKAGMVRFFAPLLLAKHLPTYANVSAKSSFTITTGAVSQRPHKDWSVVNSYATGLQGMCRGLALDLAPLRVNLVSPGFVESPLWDHMESEARDKLRQHTVASLPTGRLPLPEDVAEQYLASMKDQNCTGTMFCSNGGTLLK